MLDRAALEFCLADAFHPGCEMTWPMRVASMYWRRSASPRRRAGPSRDYGAVLTPDRSRCPLTARSAGSVPGGITRWMAVPWQTDTASCRSGYDPKPTIPTCRPSGRRGCPTRC